MGERFCGQFEELEGLRVGAFCISMLVAVFGRWSRFALVRVFVVLSFRWAIVHITDGGLQMLELSQTTGGVCDDGGCE